MHPGANISSSALRWLSPLLATAATVAAHATVCADDWSVVACLDARGDLQQDAEAHAALLKAGVGEGPLALQVIRTCNPEGLKGWRWTRGGRTQSWCEPWAGTEEATLARAIASLVAWGGGASERARLLVVLFGHGLPASSGEDLAAGAPRLFGTREGGGVEAAAVARALRQGLEQVGRERVDVLVLEACFSASLDILYELRTVAATVLAVPGEAASPGLPWREMVTRLRSSSHLGPRDACMALLEAVRSAAVPQQHVPWSVTACDLSAMEAVVDAVATVSRACIQDLPSAAAAVVTARHKAARGEALRQLSDVRQMAEALDAYASDEGLRAALHTLHAALNVLVVGRAAVGGTPDESWSERAGLTLLLPPILTRSVEGYCRSSAFARVTGYDRFLTAYLGYCAGMVPGLGTPLGH